MCPHTAPGPPPPLAHSSAQGGTPTHPRWGTEGLSPTKGVQPASTGDVGVATNPLGHPSPCLPGRGATRPPGLLPPPGDERCRGAPRGLTGAASDTPRGHPSDTARPGAAGEPCPPCGGKGERAGRAKQQHLGKEEPSTGPRCDVFWGKMGQRGSKRIVGMEWKEMGGKRVKWTLKGAVKINRFACFCYN